MSKLPLVLAALFTLLASPAAAQDAATPASAAAASKAAIVASDLGARGRAAKAGDPLPNLTPLELNLFNAGKEEFEQAEGVGDGLGPRFNLDGCAGCHAQPAVGGTSPGVNPQVAVATAFGANNKLPFFVTADGPVREARFIKNADGSPDGGVHALFVISGRVDSTGDASGCRTPQITQEEFQTQFLNGNLIFRIPTPMFGAGLIEAISDTDIVANQAVEANRKADLGISGHPNRNGNDGTIARFGWKAQNKSLLLFSGEAYNVEMGITNELFQTEREENGDCQFARTPNDITNAGGGSAVKTLSGIEKFSLFMRFLAPPAQSPPPDVTGDSIANGRTLFESVGCALCHTPTLRTGNAAVEALRFQDVNLFSDLLLHNMGSGLADGIFQGQAGPDEFRTAPLWGLGQRLFFLHDGRTRDLFDAIQAHYWSDATSAFVESEANAVVLNFNSLDPGPKQDLINFLRSL